MIKRYTLIIIFTGFLIQGCAGPASFQIASLASAVVTGKGVSDHAMSAATGRDCAFFNLIQNNRVCHYSDYAEITLLTNNQNIDDQLLIVNRHKDLY